MFSFFCKKRERAVHQLKTSKISFYEALVKRFNNKNHKRRVETCECPSVKREFNIDIHLSRGDLRSQQPFEWVAHFILLTATNTRLLKGIGTKVACICHLLKRPGVHWFSHGLTCFCSGYRKYTMHINLSAIFHNGCKLQLTNGLIDFLPGQKEMSHRWRRWSSLTVFYFQISTAVRNGIVNSFWKYRYAIDRKIYIGLLPPIRYWKRTNE